MNSSLVVSMRALAIAGFALALSPRSGSAQDAPAPARDAPVAQVGIRQHFEVSSVGAAVSYSSQQVPNGSPIVPDVYLGDSESVSVSMSMGWSRIAPRSFMSVSSSSLYGTRLQSRSWKNWNQGLGGVLSRPIGKRWTVSASGDGSIVNFDDALFAASSLARIASTDASFADLSGAMLEGRATDPALANAGGFQQDSTAGRFLVGRRTGSLGVNAALSYSSSSRLTFGVSGSASHIRQFDDGTESEGFPYARITSGGAGGQVSYRLAPRTQIGVNANVSRSFTRQFENTGASGAFSFSRSGRRWWFADASVGVGANLASGDLHQTITYTGSVGLRTSTHTVLASYGRGIGDPYVLALGTPEYSDAVTAAWHWTPRRATWWVGSAVSDLRATTTGVAPTNSWNLLETFGQRLGPRFALTAEYSFGRLGALRYIENGQGNQLQQTAMRVSFNWYPSGRNIPRRVR